MLEPTVKQVPHVWHRPDGDVDDPWAWLRDRDDPDTIAYLEAENRYADAWLDTHGNLVTEVQPLKAFYAAEDYHQEYFELNGEQPYCSLVIAPKVAKFKKRFAAILK